MTMAQAQFILFFFFADVQFDESKTEKKTITLTGYNAKRCILFRSCHRSYELVHWIRLMKMEKINNNEMCHIILVILIILL